MNNKVYIAGKVTGDPDYKAKFEKAEKKVRDISFFDRNGVQAAIAGWFFFEPVSPAAFIPEGTRWRRAMAICIWRLIWCSHVYMLKDWRESRGARKEHRWAKFLHKHIIYEK